MSRLIHLNNAGCAPMCDAAANAIHRAAEESVLLGYHGREQAYRAVEGCRSAIARLINCSPDQIALFQNCSTAISAAAFGLGLRPGDRIVTWKGEYGANAYPWHAAAGLTGARVVDVAPNADLTLDLDKFLAAVYRRTRVVAVSWAQSDTGSLTPLEPVAKRCRELGAWLAVDAIQGLGILPFDFPKSGADIVFGGAHKWLRGPVGLGFMAIKRDRIKDLFPLLQGSNTYGLPDEPVEPGKSYRSGASRFEPGSPALFSDVGTAAAIDSVLEKGVARISAAALYMRKLLVEGLLSHGATVYGPRSGKAAPIVLFSPRGDFRESCNALDAAKVSYAVRRGAIRLSPHSFNTQWEIERALKALEKAAPRTIEFCGTS